MDKFERQIIESIDNNREKIIEFAKSIKGEKGFYEHDSAEKTARAFSELGLSPLQGLAETGVKAEKRFSDGPKLAIIGELDGIACPSHPLANPENGVAHACGHSAQLAAVYGAAIALSAIEGGEEICGSAVFFAVPCEEFIPLTPELCAVGITQPAGKPELIKRGAFNDINAAMVTHIHMMPYKEKLVLGFNACCGFTAKTVTIRGVAAHAAAAPFSGINALNAASLALNAIGLLRETFKESDCIRIHTNIVKGGTALNVVPDEVIVKAMIRGITPKAVDEAAAKFDNAFIHCAAAIGARADIETEAGYTPTPYIEPCEEMRHAAQLLGINAASASREINFASTDVGFLASAMPVIAFMHGGAEGALHSADFKIVSEDDAYIMPAKIFALTAYSLLRNNAGGLKALSKNYEDIQESENG